MTDPSVLHGRRLAMIAWAKKADGSEDVAGFTGIAHWDGIALTMLRQPEGSSYVVDVDWLDSLRPVEADLRETPLEAEYCFSVSVGGVEDEDVSTFYKTGLKWPTDGGAG
jgi:hypothetical protein